MTLSRKRFDCLALLVMPVILLMVAPVSGQAPGVDTPPDGAGQPLPKATDGQPYPSGIGRGGLGVPNLSGDPYSGQPYDGISPYRAVPSGSGRLVSSGNVMISWSKDNDELRGFSSKTGEWTALKMAKQKKIVPVVGENVAAVSLGSSMAAFSGETGTWDVLKLREGSKAVPMVDTNLVQTSDNNYLYTFAASKGKWTSPNDPNFRRSWRALNPLTAPAYSNQPPEYIRRALGGILVPPKKNRFDQQALKLAWQFQGKGLDDAEARTEITKAVSHAFDRRQAHQKAEAARMQEKLKKIQAALTSRQSLRTRIIARRVDELLDPNVAWDEQSSAPLPRTRN